MWRHFAESEEESAVDEGLYRTVLAVTAQERPRELKNIPSRSEARFEDGLLVTFADRVSRELEPLTNYPGEGKDAAGIGAKKIMEINTEHPVIKNLSRIYIEDKNSPMLSKCITQLYESALIIDGDLSSLQKTDFVRRMTDIMEEATK